MRWTLVALAALCAAPLVAQESSKPDITLPREWKVGETLAYEVVRERFRVVAEARHPQAVSTTPITLEVLRKDADGWVFGWTQGRTTFEGTAKRAAASRHPAMQALLEIGRGLTTELRTDHRGVPIRLVNGKDVQSYYRARVAEIRKKYPDAARGPAGTVLTNLETQSSPERMEPTALRLPIILLMTGGAALTRGEKVHYEDRIADPFGASPLPAKASFELTALDSEAKRATIVWKRTLDREKSADYLVQTARQAVRGRDGAVPAGYETPKVDIADEATYTIDTRTGWPIEVVYREKSITGMGGHVETTTFRRKTN